jgi:16S rRNA (guanine1516-N2)-methyltransferase
MATARSLSVSCTASTAALLQKAEDLAKKLRVPCAGDLSPSSGPYLLYTAEGLELHLHLDGSDSRRPSVLFIDFIGGKTGYRRLRNCTINQPLARAVGIKPGFRPTVFDATAGMGGDAFVLACLGCQVTMNERSPVIAALLQDALDRALIHPDTAEICLSRLHLTTGEARKNLPLLAELPHSVYIDPMYPHRGKSALNSKNMRILRAIVGDDDDSPSLLSEALQVATNRVVVKRPKGAASLAGAAPTHQIFMKNSRFDVYLTHHL